MSAVDILEHVALDATGPWVMPSPQRQKIDWLRHIHQQGGKGYLDVGLHLLHGMGALDQEPEQPFIK